MPQDQQNPPKTQERIQHGKALSEILQSKLHLSAPEAEAYISLLLMGQLTSSEVSYYSGLPQGKVDAILKTLSEKRLVRVTGGIVNRYFALAPYKILANTIQEFQTQLTTFQKNFQTKGKSVTAGIEARFEQITAKISQNLKDWGDKQSSTLTDTWNSAKNMLETAAQDLHNIMADFSDSSSSRLTEKATHSLQIFQKSIMKGMEQLQETLTKNRKSSQRAITKQGKTSEECLTSASNRLLQLLETASTNVKSQLNTSKAAIQKITETSTSSVRSEFTSSRNQMQKEIQQVTTEAIKAIEDLDEKQIKAIDEWHTLQAQTIATIGKRVKGQISESGKQGIELLGELISRIGEMYQEEHQQLIQSGKQTKSAVDSAITKSKNNSFEISDRLSENLEKTLTEYAHSLKQLKSENTITQFSPESLTTSYLIKIKESYSKLTHKASEEYEKLLDSVNETLGAQVSQAYLEQLAALRTLLESLQQDLSKQQSNLAESIENIASQVTTETATQIASLQSTANTTIQNIEELIRLLKKQEHAIKQRQESIIEQQLAVVTQGLNTTKSRFGEATKDIIEKTQQTIETLSATSITHITEYNTSFQKQIDTLEALVVKEANQTTLAIQQEFEQIQETVEQYVSGTAKTQLNTILTQKSHSVKEKLDNFRTEIGEILAATSKNIRQETAGVKDRINQEINTVREGHISQLAALRTLLESLQQDLSKQQSNLAESIENIASQVTTETATQIASLQSTANTTIQNLQTSINQQEKMHRELEQQIKTIMEQQAASAGNELDKASTQISEFIQDKVKRTEETVKQLGTTSTAKITEYRSAFEEQMKVFETNVNKESNECISSLQKELVQFCEKVTKIVDTTETITDRLQDNLNTQISDFTQTYRTHVSQYHDSTRQYLLGEIQKIITKFEEQQNTLIPYIEKSGQETRQSLEDSLSYTLAIIDESSAKGNAESEKIATDCRTSLKSTIDNTKAILSEKLTTIRDTLTRTHDQTLHKVVENLTAFQGISYKALSDAENSLESEISTSKGIVEQELDQSTRDFVKGVEKIARVLTDNTEEAIRLSNETLRGGYEVAGSEIQQHINGLIQVLSQSTNSAKEKLLTRTQQIQGRISSHVEENSQALRTVAQTSTQTIATAIAESRDLTISILNEYTETVLPLTRSVQSKSESTQNMLSNLWEMLGTLQASEIERTWHVVTREKIKIRLKDMLKRAKSTITLVFPNFDEVPQKTLMAIAPEVRIHVVTKIEEKHAQPVQRLLEQGNIRLWQIVDMPFYAGARDSEEVLIAPVHDESDDVVAIVSDQESYISLFNKALGPRWISSAKEIQQG